MADRGATLIETIVASALLATGGATALLAWSHLASASTRLLERPGAIATVLALRDDLSRAAVDGMLCEAATSRVGVAVEVVPGCDDPGPWQVRVQFAATSTAPSPRIWWTVVP